MQLVRSAIECFHFSRKNDKLIYMGILTKTQDYDPVNTIAVIKRTKDDSETGGAVHFRR